MEGWAGRPVAEGESFGIAHYCGYGRDTVERMPQLLDVIRAGEMR
jgi:hypothetical protein